MNNITAGGKTFYSAITNIGKFKYTARLTSCFKMTYGKS